MPWDDVGWRGMNWDEAGSTPAKVGDEAFDTSHQCDAPPVRRATSVARSHGTARRGQKGAAGWSGGKQRTSAEREGRRGCQGSEIAAAREPVHALL